MQERPVAACVKGTLLFDIKELVFIWCVICALTKIRKLFHVETKVQSRFSLIWAIFNVSKKSKWHEVLESIISLWHLSGFRWCRTACLDRAETKQRSEVRLLVSLQLNHKINSWWHTPPDSQLKRRRRHFHNDPACNATSKLSPPNWMQLTRW